MIDLVKIENFVKYEKILGQYIDDRVGYYKQSDCYRLLEKRINLLNASWDMRSGEVDNLGRFSFKADMSYGLVKQQQLMRQFVAPHLEGAIKLDRDALRDAARAAGLQGRYLNEPDPDKEMDE